MPQSRSTFLAIFGCIFALGALGIDTVLPALPQISNELASPSSNHASLVISLFILGMGLGMPVGGPLSDQFGRKPIMLFGISLYLISAVLGYFAPNLILLCTARLLQGIGASCTTVSATASMRDRYHGAQMASMMSYAMMVFALVPAVAPYLGQNVMWLGGWRAIFIVFVAFALLLLGAIFTQIDESLTIENRKAFNPRTILSTLKNILSIRQVRLAICGLVLVQGMLFSTLTSIQPIFDKSFGKAETFPLWFAMVGVAVFSASFLNGKLVKRYGMLRMLGVNLTFQTFFTCAVTLVFVFELLPAALEFPVYVVWTFSLFFIFAASAGNFIAIAMEPMGQMAGIGASLITASGMLGGSLISIPIGQGFDGTPRPLMLALAVLVLLALWQVRQLSKQPAKQTAPGLK